MNVCYSWVAHTKKVETYVQNSSFCPRGGIVSWVFLLSRTNDTCFSLHYVLCPSTSHDRSLMAVFTVSLVPQTAPSSVLLPVSRVSRLLS